MSGRPIPNQLTYSNMIINLKKLNSVRGVSSPYTAYLWNCPHNLCDLCSDGLVYFLGKGSCRENFIRVPAGW